MLLNVYSIKNLRSSLRVRARTCSRACSWGFLLRRGQHWSACVRVLEEGGVTTFTVWVLRADGLSSGQEEGVTWVQWPPGSVTRTPSRTSMKSDCLIRGKQKCSQSERTSHRQQQNRRCGRISPVWASCSPSIMRYWWWKGAGLLHY